MGNITEVVKCKSTTVKPVTNIIIEGYEHAGIITHKCCLAEGHDGPCKCGGACQEAWWKFRTVK